LTETIYWSDRAYCRMPVSGLDEHQTDVFQGDQRTGFFISSCKPLIYNPLIQSGKPYEDLRN
ncbi:MAG: hypothetical protein KAQ72_15375, partial [Desulfobacula sp.]|nr:hypothetical protein [Desulfobacula sp.]